MTSARFLSAYIQWHFGTGFWELYEFWKNLSWFGYHFFSIPLLFKTLLRPLYRIHESAPPGSGLKLELFFENLTVNMIARVVGFFLRVLLIICGACYQLILLFIGLLLFVIWFFLPLLPLILILLGLNIMF